MALLPDVYAVLAGDGPVAAILGAEPAVYAHGLADNGAVAPYIVWSVVGDEPQTNLSDAHGTDRLQLHVDCYHPEDVPCEQLAEAVRDALERVSTFTGIAIDEREEDTGLYRIGMGFDWWLGR